MTAVGEHGAIPRARSGPFELSFLVGCRMRLRIGVGVRLCALCVCVWMCACGLVVGVRVSSSGPLARRPSGLAPSGPALSGSALSGSTLLARRPSSSAPSGSAALWLGTLVSGPVARRLARWCAALCAQRALARLPMAVLLAAAAMVFVCARACPTSPHRVRAGWVGGWGLL